ncbi:MAG: tRNA pseudouridine(38-40) synthase TruA [Kiloniellales bacterium]|nr:tRNA pseudouridine(38-40) synthase TruA [Kiloniellales bacterium]
MPRYKLTLEYDGGPYVGWQRQENGPSVQAALESAFKAFCGEDVLLHAAGRTDAGVHARGQVAHLDLVKPQRPDKIRDGVNFHLKGEPIALLEAEVVGEAFHARFSAVRRSYLYRIINRRAPLALDCGRAWFYPRPLDTAAMQAGAERLIGNHDFSAFRASECQAKSPLKTLDRLEIVRNGDEIAFTVSARSFLHHQVRNLVGTLSMVGDGKKPAAWVSDVLESRDRRNAGPTAPAAGLYLMDVGYSED